MYKNFKARFSEGDTKRRQPTWRRPGVRGTSAERARRLLSRLQWVRWALGVTPQAFTATSAASFNLLLKWKNLSNINDSLMYLSYFTNQTF